MEGVEPVTDSETEDEYWTPRRRAVWAAAFAAQFEKLAKAGVRGGEQVTDRASKWADLVAAWAPEEK